MEQSHLPHFLRIYTLLFLALFILATNIPEANAQTGNLFVSPQRLALDKKKKTDQLHLVNKSDEVKSYEISLKNYAMNDQGRLGSEVEDMPFSSKKFIRFSPRRVTLQPGEDQYVRVMLRLPKDIANGGYHSHIEFSEIENTNKSKDGAEDEAEDAKVSFKVGAAYGVAIPLFINVGKPEGSLKLGEINSEITNGHNTGKATVTLHRQGNSSVQKKLTIYYVDKSDKEHLVITPTHISVYREIDSINREFHLRLPEGGTFASGSLKVVLSELSNQKILDEAVVSIK